MRAAEFDARYRSDADPWGYRDSPYERDKYAAALAACGPGPFSSTLELGGSIGVFSALLAPRCRELSTLDFSPVAVAAARLELARFPHARPLLGAIPADIPVGAYDLVVASEVLYYLTAEALAATLDVLADRLAPGGRLVLVHWRPTGPERPLSAERVHAEFRGQAWLTGVGDHSTDDYLLDVLARS